MGGKASTASKNKWNAKTYDRINLTVKKARRRLYRPTLKRAVKA